MEQKKKFSNYTYIYAKKKTRFLFTTKTTLGKKIFDVSKRRKAARQFKLTRRLSSFPALHTRYIYTLLTYLYTNFRGNFPVYLIHSHINFNVLCIIKKKLFFLYFI